MKKGNKFYVSAVIFFLIIGLSITASIGAGDNPINPTEENVMEDGEFCGYEIIDGKYYYLNEFPPLTEEDLLTADPNPQPTMAFDEIPSQFSWMNYGGDWTTSAKDQAGCGSCWAFGALGGLEAAINIASGYPNLNIDLSEQYVLSCLSAAGSCSGGWMHEAIDYIYSTDSGAYGNDINGCPIESCMPYTATDYIPCADKCEDWDYYTDPPASDNKLWQIVDWGWTNSFSEDDPNDWDIIKTWVLTYGPIIVDIYTGGWSGFWSSHHDPNDVYQNDDPGTTNHAQVLVGWKDDTGITGGGYWILKNSWGTDWGYDGFSNIAYGCNGVATRDTTWVTATEWPPEHQGPGPGRPDAHVFADFSYSPSYPKLGDEIEFVDESQGSVVLREWDFNGDGIIDSTAKRPKYIFYEEGEYGVTLNVWSSAGLNSTVTYVVEVKEIWPPIVIASPEYYGGDDFSITFEGRHSYDVDGSIVSYHWDFDDGTTSDLSHLTHVFSEGDRIYDVVLTLTDNEGGTSTANCDVRIDITVPPVTEAHFDIGYNDNEWYKTSKKVTLVAEDWSGVHYTMYKVDNGDWQECSSPFMVSSEGEHTISFYSVDVHGNTESTKSETLRIDKTPPSLDISVSGTQQSGWYTSPVVVTLSGSDDLSGLNKIIYKVDYEPWADYSGSFTLTEGEHRLWAYAVDNAGNNYGSDDPMLIKIDCGPPETTCILTGDGSNNNFYQTVTVSFVASDLGSGVDAIYYSIDGSSEAAYSDPFEVDVPGDHIITFHSTDRIGNDEGVQSVVFTVSTLNFDMEIAKPASSLYIFGTELFKLGNPFIIGGINIEVTVTSISGSGPDVEYVEFFIDGVSKMIDSAAPFEWMLDEQLFGAHEIKVTAYGGDGSITKTIGATFLIF